MYLQEIDMKTNDVLNGKESFGRRVFIQVPTLVIHTSLIHKPAQISREIFKQRYYTHKH